MPRILAGCRTAYSHCGFSLFDIATCDKISVIKKLLHEPPDGLSLDIGIGTGYTTLAVRGDTPTVCLDIHEPNLSFFWNIFASIGNRDSPECGRRRAAI
jgi:hypothetical protein